MAKGRGRLSSLQLLPRECSHIVQWAAAELQLNARTQTEIYREFALKLEEVQRESRGEIDFQIPSIKSFNRYSINLDAMTRDLNETREMAAAIAGTFDASENDDLTLMVTEAIKAMVFTMLRDKKDKIDAKGLASLSTAVHKAAQAQTVSTARRQKIETELGKLATIVDQAEGAAALGHKLDGKEVLRRVREDIYGIFEK